MKGFIASLIPAISRSSSALILPYSSRTAYNCLIQTFLPFGRDERAFQKKFIKREGSTPPELVNLLKTISKNFHAYFFE